MPPLLRSRNAPVPESGGLNPVYIAGFCLIGFIVFALAIWLFVRLQRKRSTAKREETRGAGFLSVRGVVNESSEKGP